MISVAQKPTFETPKPNPTGPKKFFCRFFSLGFLNSSSSNFAEYHCGIRKNNVQKVFFEQSIVFNSGFMLFL